MSKIEKRVLVIVIVCVVILIGAFIADRVLGKSYLKELSYQEFMDKMENKESFVLLLSQTTCSHCMDYKPRLEKVTKEYKVVVYYMEMDLLGDRLRDNFKNNYFSYDGTPTTIFIVNGEEKSAATRIEGDASEEKIISKFKSNGFIK